MRVRNLLLPLVAACLLTSTLGTLGKVFQLAGGAVDLPEVTSTVEVFYQAMRYNRVSNQWNFDLVLRNTAVAPLNAPVVVLVDSYQNTTGPIGPDGRDDQGKAFYDVSSLIPAGGLLTDQQSSSRTLALGVSSGVPQVTMKVYAAVPPAGPALAFVRTLNEVGQPLTSAVVVQSGPAGQGTNTTDALFGVATLGQGAGSNGFSFSADGYLPAWRWQTLVPGTVIEVPSPRMARRGTNSVAVALNGGGLTNTAGNFQITLPAGAFSSPGTATLTPLTGQTLPALLPAGWSPLQAFCLELSSEPSLPLPTHFDLWGPVNRDEVAALVHWNAAALQWEVSSLVTGLGAASVNVPLSGSGAWALVVADAGALAPPAPQAGQPLLGANAPAADYSRLQVASTVMPSSSSPSRQAELVTATASLTISNQAGALVSGTLLRAKVTERYQMRDGSTRISPAYEAWLLGYQRPGTANPAVLYASFPLRPLLLLGGDELLVGTVNVDILPPSSFAGAVLTSAGGSATNGSVVLSAVAGSASQPQALQLADLGTTNFSSLAGEGLVLVGAFQLTIGQLDAGAQLALQMANVPANSQFVLARVLSDAGVYGLQPVARLTSDTNGALSFAEPSSEPKLPGLSGSGQFVLAQVAAAQSLVTGTSRNVQSNAVPGMVVRLGPWVARSASDGSYRLLAPAGNATLNFLDPTTGDTASRLVAVATNQPVVLVPDQLTGSQPPSVVSVSPSDGSTNVPLVASITVNFSKPLNPGSAVGSAVQLLEGGTNPVPASFSLNLRGDQITFLPVNPLDPQAAYTLVLATNLADLGGLTLVGPNQFSFTTAAAAFVHSPGAQLILYEPTNGMMRMEGSGGFAQPGQPVLLVNETSGRTATVLAQPDGSFSGSLPASVDDQMSVTVVNDNGTRDSIRPDRLLYGDGTVGLFSKGGSVAADTENGPMQVLVDAGSLQTPARFKIEPVAASNLADVVSNAVPTTGKLVGAFRFLATGGELNSQAHVSYPIDVSSLGLAADDSPSNHVFLLCEVINVDGQTVYRIADTMSFEAGQVVTHSPPFEGLMYLPGAPAVFAMAMLPLSFREEMQVLGYVVAAPASAAATLDNQGVADALLAGSATVRRVSGALVEAHPGGIGLGGLPGLQPGAFVARSNSRGAYVLLVPFNPFEEDAISVSATSPLLPNLKGFRAVSRYSFQLTTAVNVVIPVPDTPSGILDFTPPLIAAQPPSSTLPVGTNVSVPFLLRDDQTQPYLRKVEFEPSGSVDYQTGAALDPATVIAPDIGQGTNLDRVSTLQGVSFKVNRAGWVRFRLYADDQSGNESEATVAFRFGAPPSDTLGSVVPSSTNDTVGPMVVSALPGTGGLLSPGDPIDLSFSEAVRPSSTNGVAIDGGATLEMQLSANQRALRLIPGNLQPGSNYTITVSSEVRDLAGNSLDQDPATPSLEPFTFQFSTPQVNVQSLPGVVAPAGSVIHGNYAFTIDRIGTTSGYLRIHRLSGSFPLVNSIYLPAFPRALTLIPQYSFKRRPEGAVETKPLLVVVGGLAGTAQVATWLRIFDISQPEATGIWTSPTTPVPVNTNAWVAGALLSADPAAVPTNVKFSAPRLAVQIVTSEGSFVDLINLQGLILGANMQSADWSASTNRMQFIPGKDLNGDGDYVDAGEQLPFPQYGGLFGLEAVVGPVAGRDITDFDLAAGGMDVVALLPQTSTQPERFQVLTADGAFIGDGSDATGGYEFSTNSASFPTNHAFRVALDLDFPVPDSGGLRKLPVALVSGGDLLRLIDISVPQTPVLLNQFRLGSNSGTIFSITRTGADEYTLGAANGVWTVRRSDLYAQGNGALNQFVSIPFEGRALGSASGWYVAASGNQLQVALRPPRISVVIAPTFATTNIASLLAAGPDQVRSFLQQVTEPNLLLPVIQRNIGTNCPEGLFPPNPVAHHYVLVQASGDLGPTLQVAAESLDAQGRRLSPRGLQWPPIMLSGHIDDLALTAQQPAVQPLVARRLADSPTSDYYNLFATDPFVLVREPLNATNLFELPLIPGRQAIWSGQMLRLSLEGPSVSDLALSPYLSRVSATREFQTGVSHTYRCLPGDFTGNPNPSLPASPTVAGVNLQSGAYRTKAGDLYIAGRNQPLVLTRSYDSRSQYFGPLGRGWDFNWNAHLVELPQDMPVDLCWLYYGTPTLDSSLSASDILLVNGNGGALLFKYIKGASGATNGPAGYDNDPAIGAFGWTNAIDSYYQSPAGEFSVLYRFKDGGWVTVAPNGVRTYFRADGRLDRVVGAFEASQLTCLYREDGKLDRVSGDRGIDLRFGYYQQPGSLASTDYDRLADFPVKVGLIARVQVKSPAGIPDEVAYSYDNNGNLTGVTKDQGLGTIYGYDSNPPYQLTSIGRGDGAQYPSQRIVYTNGIVSKITQDGEDITFAGAKQTAADRYATPTDALTVKIGASPAATYTVDNRGRPVSFANLTNTADDAGRLAQVANAETKTVMKYDTNNAVYRFRGNLIGTSQPGRASFDTHFSYDGSAWNRLCARSSAEGVLTTNIYVTINGVVDHLDEITGPITNRSHLNEFGQLLKAELISGDHTLVRNILFSPDTQLPAGEQLGESAAADFSHNQLGGVDGFGGGSLGYTNQYNDDQQLAGLVPSGTNGPGLDLGYTNGLVSRDHVYQGGLEMTHTYQYDPQERSRVHQVTSQETGLPDSTMVYNYDDQGRLKSYDENGETTTLVYASAQVTELHGPGRDRVINYKGSLPTNITEQGVSAALAYDDQQRVQSITQQGATYTFSYNLGSQLASKTITDQNGTLLDESYGYDAAGRVTGITNETEGRSFEYFGDGQLRRAWLNDLVVQEMQRDDAGRITQASIPGVLERHFSNPASDTSVFQHEELRLFSSQGGVAYRPFVVDRTYDAFGRELTESRPCGAWTNQYDGFGHLVSRSDPDGVSYGQKFSPGGLTLQTRFSDGSTVDYSYDANRRLLSVGALTNSYSSEQKLLESVQWPDGSLSQFGGYDVFMEPESVQHGSLRQAHTWQDGRLQSIVSGTDELDYSYDGFGRPTTIMCNHFAVDLDYTDHGQLDSETATSPDSATPVRQWSAVFTNQNRFVSETYPSGLEVDWSPNTFGLSSSATNIGINSIQWLGPDMLTAVVFTNGLRIVKDYDDSQRVVGIRYLTGDYQSPVTNAAFLYQLSPGGRILSESRVHEGRSDVFKRNTGAKGMRITKFLLSASDSTTGSGAEATVGGFSFDSNGELIESTNNSSADARALFPQVVLSQGRLTNVAGVPVLYNDRGSVRQVPVWVRLPGQTTLTLEQATLTYDGFDMLSHVERGSGAQLVSIDYVRDGLGRIVQRTVAGPTDRCHPGVRQYFWRGRQLLEEYDQAGGQFQLARRYVYIGSDLVLVQAASAPGGALTDYIPLVSLNGSVGGYLRADGSLQELIVYGPYGTPVFRTGSPGAWSELETSSVGATLLFQGAWFDEESGLYQVGERNLHPLLGSFLQRDNRLYVASRALYTAFNGDPAGVVDPSGALPENLQKLSDIKDALMEVKKNTLAFNKALMAERNWEPRKETALAQAGLDLTKSLFSYAEKFNDNNFAQFSKAVTGSFEQIKTGLDTVQELLDWRKDRLILTAIRANTEPYGNFRFETRWLAAGGSLADLSTLDANFFAEKDVLASKDVLREKGAIGAFNHFREAQQNYIEQREGHLLNLAKTGAGLARAYFEYAYRGDKSSEVQTARQILEGSELLLKQAELYRGVARDAELSKMAFSLGEMGSVAGWEKMFGVAGNVQAAFDGGMEIGQYGILTLSDPWTAKAYKEACEQFKSNGGWLSVFGGLLETAGWDRGAYQVQKWADSGWKTLLGDAANSYIQRISQPDPRWEMYRRDLNAP